MINRLRMLEITAKPYKEKSLVDDFLLIKGIIKRNAVVAVQ